MVYEYIEETLKLFEGCYAIDEKKTMGSQTGLGAFRWLWYWLSSLMRVHYLIYSASF